MAKQFDMVRIFMLFAATLSLTGCRSMQTPGTPEVISMSRIINKTSNDSDLCNSFALTKENVATYFSLADEVKTSQFDQQAMILPCRYQGRIKISDHLYQWEIIAGGAGYLYDNKIDKRFICHEKCLDVLPNVRGP